MTAKAVAKRKGVFGVVPAAKRLAGEKKKKPVRRAPRGQPVPEEEKEDDDRVGRCNTCGRLWYYMERCLRCREYGSSGICDETTSATENEMDDRDIMDEYSWNSG